MSERWLVTPGDLVTDQKVKLGPNVFVEGGKVYSKILGLAEVKDGVARVIPLEGRYIPKEGDPVIGFVVDVKIPGYDIDLNSPYTGFLPNEELSEEANYGDVVIATVKRVDAVRNALLERGNILRGGEIITINPKKVPRVIGKKKSMLTLLQNLTGVSIMVGANGRIWLYGKNIDVAKEAIFKIEQEAHTSGLTDRITKFIEEELHEREEGKEA
jgi:exosome complex component RRP4